MPFFRRFRHTSSHPSEILMHENRFASSATAWGWWCKIIELDQKLGALNLDFSILLNQELIS